MKASNWPHIALLVYLDEPDEVDVQAMSQIVEGFMAQNWHPSPPRLVNEEDNSSSTAAEDVPLWTVGVLLDILAPVGPSGQRLSREADLIQLDQVERLLRSIGNYSRRTGKTLVLSYEGNDIGEIVAGELDRSIVEGLLEPWRTALAWGDQ